MITKKTCHQPHAASMKCYYGDLKVHTNHTISYYKHPQKIMLTQSRHMPPTRNNMKEATRVDLHKLKLCVNPQQSNI